MSSSGVAGSWFLRRGSHSRPSVYRTDHHGAALSVYAPRPAAVGSRCGRSCGCRFRGLVTMPNNSAGRPIPGVTFISGLAVTRRLRSIGQTVGGLEASADMPPQTDWSRGPRSEIGTSGDQLGELSPRHRGRLAVPFGCVAEAVTARAGPEKMSKYPGTVCPRSPRRNN